MNPALRFLGAAALAGAAALSLTSCGAVLPAAVTTAAATVSAAVLPPGDLATIQKVCVAAQPLLAPAAAGADKTVADIAAYPLAYCRQLGAAPAGQVPATTTATTLAWLQAAIQLAGIVLPLVL